MTPAEYQADLERHAAELNATLKWIDDPFHAQTDVGRRISDVPRIKDYGVIPIPGDKKGGGEGVDYAAQAVYFTCMHELGHVATTPKEAEWNWDENYLKYEVNATQWALDNACEKPDDNSRAVFRLITTLDEHHYGDTHSDMAGARHLFEELAS